MHPAQRLLVTLLSFAAAHAVVAPACAATREVADIAALQSALKEAQPGDRIVLKAGRHETTAAVRVTAVGTANAPIVIAAETVGAVELAGTHGFIVSKPAAHVTIDGFTFTHASGRNVIELGTRHVRFTRNTFRCVGDNPYLSVLGDDAEVDYNEFRDKKTVGNMISVTGENGQVARRLHVHHNYFHDFSPAGANGAETIRVGLSGLSMSHGHAVIEHNLFERCRGENELISNKSGGNTYRFNTFIDSPGAQLTLRHGNECVVYGNYFKNTAGLRIFGDRHQVFSNYFVENSTGINIGNGGAEVADGAKLTSHDRPDNCVIAFNTLINNRTHYYMGERKPTALGATNTTFANNLLVGGEQAVLIEGPYHGALWSGNVLWKVAGAGSLPESGFSSADPRLATDAAGILRPQKGSPVIDAAVGAYPAAIVDLDGQPRTIAKDIGADEFSDLPAPARMLTPSDVGPRARP